MTTKHVPSPTAEKPPEPRTIWGRLTVDPLAVPLSRQLVKLDWVTANRITGLAFVLALGAAACFATGQLRWGGALFLARFFCDCLDGMVARSRGTSSARGAAFDISVDVIGTHLAAAALVGRLAADGDLPVAAAVLLLAVLGIHNWSLAHRKGLAGRAGLGGGGFDHRWRHRPRGLRTWLRFTERMNMVAFPWALEVEIVVLGLGPMLLPRDLLHWTVWFGCLGWAVVAVVSLIRIRGIATEIDTSRRNHA